MNATQAATVVYPLRALFARPDLNARKKPRTRDSVERLARSIAAHGRILHNLVVVPELDAAGVPTGRAGVAAGETRRQALCMLANGEISDVSGFDLDFPVPTVEVDPHEAKPASATENIHRVPMHPADEFEAYRDAYEDTGSAEAVAEYFGVTVHAVRQRLKLCAASPKMFQLYRDDAMTLEQLVALCASDDHEAQERVWRATDGHPSDRRPERLKALLTPSETPVSSPLMRFVGPDAYSAAGGAIREDLFAADGENAAFAVNGDLLERLALEKLSAAAAPVEAEGWSWVELKTGLFSNGYQYGRAPKSPGPMTPKQAQKLASLQKTLDESGAELARLYELDESDETNRAIDKAEAARRRTNAELHALQEQTAVWSPEVKALAGAIVAIDAAGRTHITRGLVKEEHRKALARQSSRTKGGSARAAEHGPQAPAQRAAPAQSEALTRRLTAHRTVAMQAMLANSPNTALAVLAHNLVQRMISDSTGTHSALDLNARGCQGAIDQATTGTYKDTRAWAELQSARQQWAERLPEDNEKLLPWLLSLSTADLCDVLAVCTALTLNGVRGHIRSTDADAIADALGLDMADWWEPTAGEYLTHVPKAQICAALIEAGQPTEAQAVANLTKGEAVARAQAALAGKRWVPGCVRSTQPAKH
ncbi:hypothetical protein AACH06_25715 [Ideonella sp. DXS29W]|uniref:Chromosome partitioning protein ParB n=1 Tax=Ideonella lacteola TaxID=2984193 RepID=A0ABU9BW83_9BURK